MRNNKQVNICLHNVVENEGELSSIYDITKAQLLEVVATLTQARNKGVIGQYELFFDDGYQSFWDICRSLDLGIEHGRIHVAVITDLIGTPGRLNQHEIKKLFEEGFSIDSHGASHAALAIFINDRLEPTLEGGVYQNSPYGKNSSLSHEELRFQILESSRALEKITGIPPKYFVLPFGLYNQQTLDALESEAIYEKVYSCDASFETQDFLVPRLLITQENIKELPELLRTLPAQPQLLTDL